MATQQQLIDSILEQDAETPDHSLQSKALKRALNGDVPRTLTPWEWQQWYEQNGMPEAHRGATTSPQKPWWRRWL